MTSAFRTSSELGLDHLADRSSGDGRAQGIGHSPPARPPRRRAVWAGLAAAAAVMVGLAPDPAGAHGLAGRRFFPATLVIEDPFVADELALPSFSTIKTPEGRETSIGAELAKSITPSLGISVGAEYLILDPADPGEASTDGFANPEIGVKYVLFKS